MEKHIFKLIGYGFGAIICYYILCAILPYLILFLALCGGWYLWQEYQKKGH